MLAQEKYGQKPSKLYHGILILLVSCLHRKAPKFLLVNKVEWMGASTESIPECFPTVGDIFSFIFDKDDTIRYTVDGN